VPSPPDLGAPGSVAVWFVGAIIVHDLVLLPLYSLVEQVAACVTHATPGRRARAHHRRRERWRSTIYSCRR